VRLIEEQNKIIEKMQGQIGMMLQWPTSAFASSPLSHVPNACTLLESRILLSPQDSLFGLLARTLQKDPDLSNIPLFDVEKALREIVQKTSDCLR